LKLLLDEMYTGLKDFLEAMGWGVQTVQESGLRGKDDKVVAQYAKENDLLLVTQESLPAEICDILGAKYVYIGPKETAQIVDQLIKKKYPDKK